MIVCIPTIGRENNLLTTKWISKDWLDRTYLVHQKSERHSDWKGGHLIVDQSCVGNIGKTRQWIVENSPDDFVGMLDDDINFYHVDAEKRTRRKKLTDASEIFSLMESWLKIGDVFCGTSNQYMIQNKPSEYYYGKPTQCYFLNRKYLLDNNIRYDALDYFEDYHVPLSILESGKRLHFTGDYVTKERLANAPGGCSIHRTPETNRKAMIQLQKLHPSFIKLVEEPGATNQGLEVGLKMRIAFKKCFDEMVGHDRLSFD